MIKGEVEQEIDLYDLREQIYNDFADLLDHMDAEDLDDDLTLIEYPILSVPEKLIQLVLIKLQLWNKN